MTLSVLVGVAIGVAPSPASAQTGTEAGFTDWVTVDPAAGVANGTLRGAPVSLSGSGVSAGSVTDGTFTGFAAPFFSPALPTSDAIAMGGFATTSYALDFGSPVTDPIFHVASLASRLEFPAGTVLSKVSGQDTFTVSGNAVTGAAAGATGQNSDANGTVRLAGVFNSVSFSLTPLPEAPNGDGIFLQAGAPASTTEPQPEPLPLPVPPGPALAPTVQPDRDRDGIPDVLDTSDASAGPTLAETVVARVVSGEVFVRRPTSRPRSTGRAAQGTPATPPGFVPLMGAEIVPVGSVMHTLRGRIALTSVAQVVRGRRRTQRARFFAGVFQIKQARARRPVTELALRGDFARVCGTTARGARAGRGPGATAAQRRRSSRRVSRLWGDGRGRFRTRGRYSAATLRGTIWLTEDRCDGTLTRVRRGSVGVRDFGARRTVVVRAGRSYLARAQRATARRRR